MIAKLGRSVKSIHRLVPGSAPVSIKRPGKDVAEVSLVFGRFIDGSDDLMNHDRLRFSGEHKLTDLSREKAVDSTYDFVGGQDSRPQLFVQAFDP